MQLLQRQFLFLNYLFHPGSVCFSPPDPLTFSAQWLSIPTSATKGELVQHNWLLFVCTALPVPGKALAISIRCFRLCSNRGMACPYFSLSQFPAKLGIILLKWDLPCPGSSFWRLKGKQVLCFCLSVWRRKGSVEDDSTAIPVSALQTCSSLPVLLLWLSGSTARRSSPGPSYRLLSVIWFNVSIYSKYL